MDKFVTPMTAQDLAHLGGGVLAYVREIEADDARKLMGDRIALAPTAKLFCLYNADGTPISISGSHEAAISSAMEHELVAASVH